MRWLKTKLRGLLAGSSPGFTLAELLVSVGIMTLAAGLVGGGIFQALGLSQYWIDDVVATKELRHATSWFSRDALNAQTSDLVDGAQPVSSTTITWTDQDDAPHDSIYSLVGDRLVRNYDGDPITVADKVVSVGFSRSVNTLIFTLTVNAERDGTESSELSIYARMLQ